MRALCTNTCNVLVRSDAMCVVHLLNRGSAKPHLNEPARRLKTVLAQRGCPMGAEHMRGVDNPVDALSRTTSDKNDYQLRLAIAKEGWARLGVQPVLDMFAADHNHLLARYWAWNPSPTAEAVDALQQDWSPRVQGGVLHCNPPWPLIPRILRKIRQDKARVVICLPYWVGQPWWPMLKAMLARPMIQLQGAIYQDRWGRTLPPPQWGSVMALLQG